MLIIAVGINTNDNILPLSWALVPTENEHWWTWFCNFLKSWFPLMSQKGFVFMSNRDKGLKASLNVIFPEGAPAHCC